MTAVHANRLVEQVADLERTQAERDWDAHCQRHCRAALGPPF